MKGCRACWKKAWSLIQNLDSLLVKIVRDVCEKEFHEEKRVNKGKQGSMCYRCKEKYEPLPKDKEWGTERFECHNTNCRYEFRAAAIMVFTDFVCHQCNHTLSVKRIIAPSNLQNFPPNKDTHECNGVNCYQKFVCPPACHEYRASVVKQEFAREPTLFGVFFSVLLRHAFNDCSVGVSIHTRADGGLFEIARLHTQSKVETLLIRELIFSDAATLASHIEDFLLQQVNRFYGTCKKFGLTISLSKIHIMRQGIDCQPSISLSRLITSWLRCVISA